MRVLFLSILAALWLAGCNNMFFQPDSYLYHTPDQFDLIHEKVDFKSGDGTALTGWFIAARPPVRGTIIHFHGNAANISNHLLAVQWLPAMGYSVFLFDYRGYGASAGSPTRAGVVADGVAAINYVRSRKDVDASRLVVYGQSLGGAVAVNSLAEAGTKGVKALVVEGTFFSYREAVRLIMSDTWFLWPFQYPVAYGFFNDDLSPEQALPKLGGVALLVVHGESDRTVPIEAGRQLFRAFPGPDKKFWAIPNSGHMAIFGHKGSPWRRELVKYLNEKTGDLPRPPRR